MLGCRNPRCTRWESITRQMETLVRQAGSRTGDLSDLAPSQLNVLSPIDGRIIFRDVVLGEHVHPDKTVFTASDLSTLWAFLDAREKDLPAIGAASRITIQSPVYPGRVVRGSRRAHRRRGRREAPDDQGPRGGGEPGPRR